MWVIDKMAGAQNLIDEIDFVRKPKSLPADMARPIEEGRR